MANQDLLKYYTSQRDTHNQLAMIEAKSSLKHREECKKYDKKIRELNCTIKREEGL